MKNRTLFMVLIPLVVLAALCAGLALGVRSVVEGSKPMEDGRSFADGCIERVVDGYVSSFIIDCGSGVVLVDAGMTPGAPQILAALERGGHQAADVAAILFTHGHGDHVGGALAFPDAELYALAPDADLVEGRRVAGNILGKVRQPEPSGLSITRGLEDGEVLALHGLEIEAFALPGHSLGCAAYLVKGVLFLGDAAAATTDEQLAGPPPVFSADREAGMDSLHALAERLAPRAEEIEWLVPSHQGALEGPEALLAWGE